MNTKNLKKKTKLDKIVKTEDLDEELEDKMEEEMLRKTEDDELQPDEQIEEPDEDEIKEEEIKEDVDDEEPEDVDVDEEPEDVDVDVDEEPEDVDVDVDEEPEDVDEDVDVDVDELRREEQPSIKKRDYASLDEELQDLFEVADKEIFGDTEGTVRSPVTDDDSIDSELDKLLDEDSDERVPKKKGGAISDEDNNDVLEGMEHMPHTFLQSYGKYKSYIKKWINRFRDFKVYLTKVQKGLLVHRRCTQDITFYMEKSDEKIKVISIDDDQWDEHYSDDVNAYIIKPFMKRFGKYLWFYHHFIADHESVSDSIKDNYRWYDLVDTVYTIHLKKTIANIINRLDSGDVKDSFNYVKKLYLLMKLLYCSDKPKLDEKKTDNISDQLVKHFKKMEKLKTIKNVEEYTENINEIDKIMFLFLKATAKLTKDHPELVADKIDCLKSFHEFPHKDLIKAARNDWIPFIKECIELLKKMKET